MNVGFRITSRVQIGDANKLLFALTSNGKKSIIAFFYSFDLFKSLLIISISYNGFQHGGSKNLETIVNINPKSMQIIIFSDMSPDATV